MTTEQILEGNKLIAEFMGYKFKNTKKYWGLYPLDDNSFLRSLGWIEFNNLRFHSSWDWLMPVVEKIENLDGWIQINGFKYKSTCTVRFGEMWDEISHSEGKSKIEAVYYAVVEFIKWYNNK